MPAARAEHRRDNPDTGRTGPQIDLTARNLHMDLVAVREQVMIHLRCPKLGTHCCGAVWCPLGLSLSVGFSGGVGGRAGTEWVLSED